MNKLHTRWAEARLGAVAAMLALSLAACASTTEDIGDTGLGPRPELPSPQTSLLPTINIAPVQTRPSQSIPTAPPGFTVTAFASGLEHPRWVYPLPDGDLLVAESNAPAQHDEHGGIVGWVRKQVMKFVMKRAGAGVPSPDRIVLLRGQGGTAQSRSVLISGLHSPFGMALVGDSLYVADTDALLRFPYRAGDTQITTPGEKVADLPAGPINHHWTKNVVASRDGQRLYVTVGSNSNVGENGIEAEEGRAMILEFTPATGRSRVFAAGLRNPNGMDWQPESGALWAAVNERDELGDNLVPDYMTAVKDGGFYGFPYSYYGQHVDTRVKEQRPDKVASALTPDYALGNHTASLGLAFYTGRSFPQHYWGGAFVGQHGSWNRKEYSGYKVVFVPFEHGRPAGMPETFLSGFLSADGHALGRPVGVAVDKAGALYVADDVGNVVWKVVYSGK
ncbi:glucose/arabinose dehydrogenase [Burkholderia sp. OAS925]|uniref:PQQ-dependent sugar dehydrogenase n=1 Tax=Paraburkholderia TaxID=1822464 RepID=UPI00042271A5|nr:sorbosone dehydrogenase family protein [Paraburkholderia graminis]MDQ0625417.1 glucose/arabinose dehydrogenase [Paraburkholderia graminis]MDR6476115.1 glucose/arabinose dehydrogenase [Paraburkholderia graminis]